MKSELNIKTKNGFSKLPIASLLKPFSFSENSLFQSAVKLLDIFFLFIICLVMNAGNCASARLVHVFPCGIPLESFRS